MAAFSLCERPPDRLRCCQVPTLQSDRNGQMQGAVSPVTVFTARRLHHGSLFWCRLFLSGRAILSWWLRRRAAGVAKGWLVERTHFRLRAVGQTHGGEPSIDFFQNEPNFRKGEARTDHPADRDVTQSTSVSLGPLLSPHP
jgi:hypothetical protein